MLGAFSGDRGDSMIPDEQNENPRPPLSSFVVGLAGFSYDRWNGVIYPDEFPPEKRLTYLYENRGIHLVELNGGREALGAPDYQALLDVSPEGMNFISRIDRGLTENIRDERGDFIRNEAAIDIFRRNVAPLIVGERLITLLAQFPQKFRKSDAAMEHVRWFVKALGDVAPLVVEFRHPSWISRSVFDLLRERGAGYCAIDGPDLEAFPPCVPMVTSSLGCVRYVGRPEKWYGATNDIRYGYHYKENELRASREGLRTMKQGARRVVALFNNYAGGAVDDAARLGEMLV